MHVCNAARIAQSTRVNLRRAVSRGHLAAAFPCGLLEGKSARPVHTHSEARVQPASPRHARAYVCIT
jgi:hypothetical protein